MRVPFDSLTLAAVVAELQPFVGAKVQRIVQLDEHTVVLCLYRGGEACLLLSCDAMFSRAHLITRRPGGQGVPPAFCSALRARLDGGTVVAIDQVGFDRILVLSIDHETGRHQLIVELMGKHANVILVGPDGKIVAAAKGVGPGKSKRPVTSGRTYEPPPFDPRPSLLEASPEDDLTLREGASPFLLKLMAAKAMHPSELAKMVATGHHEPVLSPGHGAYPMSVAALGLQEFRRSTISVALEQHYALAIPEHLAQQLKHSLLAQLNRVVLARDVALADLLQASDAASRAGQLQRTGEIILAYGQNAPSGASVLEAWDYEGNPVSIKLNPELGALENAQFYFAKAKKAKSGSAMVADQIRRLTVDREALLAMIGKVEAADALDALTELREEAKGKKWLHSQPLPVAKKEDRPYEGHKVRELIGPQGLKILYGETATANDYLTLRVAKPNDYWLHVRAAVSAHVVIQTSNKPEKVSQETLLYAAKVAVQNSPSKHSGYVPVDYTLKKYVRKPKGAPVGTALYTHEKTLHVYGD